jgi:heptosyltransferase-2
MQDSRDEILVWLPSPMGDAILCTPALQAIRQHFKSSRISFFAKPAVRQFLSPCYYNDKWLEQKDKNLLTAVAQLKKHKFKQAILFKNSFSCALVTFLAGIPSRIGYDRDGRGFLLTDKPEPMKLPNGKFKPISMLDYYLAIASRLGAETSERKPQLFIDEKDVRSVQDKLPEIAKTDKPVVVLVPGGAFGPSKCWPSVRFAQTADWLCENYDAMVTISVSPQPSEKRIAEEICALSKHKLINLAKRPLNPGELKALFSTATLVISNDTGPRHIAIALGRKVITLFGPNDPAWTETNCENEIQIIGNVPCAPCARKKCKKSEHLCMNSITVEMVCEAAKELLENNRKQLKLFARKKFEKIPNLSQATLRESFFIDPDYKAAFDRIGLTSTDAVFSFNAGKKLVKNNLAPYRSRLQFEISPPPVTLFLKRYDQPPISTQLLNWLWARKHVSCGAFDIEPANQLAAAGIGTPKIICYAEQWEGLFEKRSFIITEKIPNANSLERKLPEFFNRQDTTEKLRLKKEFIAKLANFIKKFHKSSYRHRDLYFSHIFYGDNGKFYLIDLARTFKPLVFSQRFRIKDIAQVHYSAPAKHFSNTDRLRFYLNYTGRKKLTPEDKIFIHKVINKARRMAQHDKKHGRAAPFHRVCDSL